MDPLTIAALLNTGVGIGKGIYGLFQTGQSKKYADTERPGYDIPEEYKQMLNSAKMQALQTQLPGQGLAEEKIGAATSKGLSYAKEATDSPASILGMTAALTGQEQEKMRDLGIAAGENYNTNQGVLRSALGTMGEQKLNKWQWEKQMPYQEAMETASGLQEAGVENMFKGLGDAAGTVTSAMGTKQYMDLLTKSSDAGIAQSKAWLDYLTGGTSGTGDFMTQLTNMFMNKGTGIGNSGGGINVDPYSGIKNKYLLNSIFLK